MGKQAVEATRGRADFEPYPEKLHVEKNPAHDLFDPRSTLPFTEGIVTELAKGYQHKDVVVLRDGPLLRIVDGHQTHSAALELNRRLVAAGKSKRKIRITLAEFASMAEAVIFARNSNKRVASPPSVMAQEIMRMRRVQVPDDEIARHFGMETAGGLKPYLALARCIPAVGHAVDAKAISLRQAMRIAEVSQDDQAGKLAEALAGGGKGGGRKAKTKSGRPTAGTIKKVAEAARVACGSGIPFGVATALGFCAGSCSAKDFAAACPELAAALGVT